MTLNDLKLRLSTMMALSRIDHFPLVFMLERMKWIVQAAMYTIAQRQPVQSGRLHMQEKEFFHHWRVLCPKATMTMPRTFTFTRPKPTLPPRPRTIAAIMRLRKS